MGVKLAMNFDNQDCFDNVKDRQVLARSIAPGIQIIIRIGQQVRGTILDYTLGAAILGLIPVYGRWIPAIRLSLLALLNLRMVVTIGRFWGHHKGQGSWIILRGLLGLLGSFLLAILAWLIVFAIGLLIPYVDGLARAIAYGVLTWNIGSTTSQYYYSPQTLDIEALEKALRFKQVREQKSINQK